VSLLGKAIQVSFFCWQENVKQLRAMKMIRLIRLIALLITR
jgi:hypothetical protein